jgi:hypothetical protein
MILQYNTMFSERKRSLVIDNINGLVESIAALLVKVRTGMAASCRTAAAPEQPTLFFRRSHLRLQAAAVLCTACSFK